EAFAMADAIGVMHRGRILQWADAQTLYRAPADRFVAGFVGRGCVLPAAALGLPGGGDVLLRPEHLVPDPEGGLQADLLAVGFRGPGQVAQVRLPTGEVVEVDLPPGCTPAAGGPLRLRLSEVSLVGFAVPGA